MIMDKSWKIKEIANSHGILQSVMKFYQFWDLSGDILVKDRQQSAERVLRYLILFSS